MSNEKELTPGQKIKEITPKLADLTDNLLFADIWERKELSPRDRSMITVACLISGGNFEQLEFHLKYAIKNGVSEEELKEAITHLAFYTGWPKAMSAINIAKQVLSSKAE